MKFSDHLKYSQLLCTVPLEHLSHTKNEELVRHQCGRKTIQNYTLWRHRHEVS